MANRSNKSGEPRKPRESELSTADEVADLMASVFNEGVDMQTVTENAIELFKSDDSFECFRRITDRQIVFLKAYYTPGAPTFMKKGLAIAKAGVSYATEWNWRHHDPDFVEAEETLRKMMISVPREVIYDLMMNSRNDAVKLQAALKLAEAFDPEMKNMGPASTPPIVAIQINMPHPLPPNRPLENE